MSLPCPGPHGVLIPQRPGPHGVWSPSVLMSPPSQRLGMAETETTQIDESTA